MSKNAQHQWEVVPGPDNLVRCTKCESLVKASRARRGVGPCIWGESGSSVPNADSPPVPEEKPGAISEQSPEAQALIAAAAKAEEQFTQEELEEHAKDLLREHGLPEGAVPIIQGAKIIGITEAPQHPGPRLTDPPEICNGCGDRLAILPLNSRLDMVACNNGRCALYRERLRMVTKPTKRGKHKRGNNN